MKKEVEKERVAFLGCSRGFGKFVCLNMNSVTPIEFSLLVSRKKEKLKNLKQQIKGDSQIVTGDLTKKSEILSLVEIIKEKKINRLLYFAGGGPYGAFKAKEWKDHLWAFQLNFLTPAFLIHQFLNCEEIKQMVFVGSLIADKKSDDWTASYSVAKKALMTLVTSLIGENPKKDLRLFNPGWMDTDLIPPGASPRQDGTELLDPNETALEFVQWINEPKAPGIFEKENTDNQHREGRRP